MEDEPLKSAVQGKRYNPVLNRVERLLAQGNDPGRVRVWLEEVDKVDFNPVTLSSTVAWPGSVGEALQRFDAAVLNHSPTAHLTPNRLILALKNSAYPEGAQALFSNPALTPEILRALLPGVAQFLAGLESTDLDLSDPRAAVAWREFLRLLALYGLETGWTRAHPAVVALWERIEANIPGFRPVFSSSVLQIHGSSRADLDVFWRWYGNAEAAEELLGKARMWAHAIVSHPKSTVTDWRRLYDSWGPDRDKPGAMGARGLWGHLLKNRPDAISHPWAVSKILRYASFTSPEETTAFMIQAAEAGSWAGVRDYVSDTTVPAAERDLEMLAFLESAPVSVLACLSIDDWARCQESKLGALRQASILKLGQPLAQENSYQPTTPAS